jgi:type I restriction-modification system DNA methylase subunit
MDQPPLPEIEPYVNRKLFSDHFLRELLPQDDSWQVDEDKLSLAMQALSNLHTGREHEWSSSNEAQLEDKLVRPVLQALEHRFEVQPSLPTADAVSRPDYAFFERDEERRRAKKDDEGKIQYFANAIAVGDAKRWDRPLDKGERGSRDKFDRLSPSWQIDYYLRMSGVKWGILTNGRLWRLYNRDTSFRLDIYYEIDLPRLLAARDLEAFRYFFLFFRREAFVRDAEGLCFLDRVYQGSLEYAQAVGDDLKENVYRALRLLAEGFLHTRGNNLNPVHDLGDIHANSLVSLYRLLFINYAEDRGLLPRNNVLYRDSYGLVSMEREIASKLQGGEPMPALQLTYWGKLRTLFDLINQGTEALGIDADTMQVPPYNGGLFDPEKHPFLEQYKVEDRWLAQVIDLLARSQGEGVGKGFVDYTSLDVRHLGSIYEGLLEYKLRVADEEMVAVKRGGKEQWAPAAEAGKSRILEEVHPGSVYLATDKGERKATGSYYTPDYIVKYIVEHTVGPLIEEKMKEDDPIEGILSLKVLDPAMGSGHFLVEATDRLAHALVEALGGAAQQPEEEEIRWARREVVERCIYGVDLNPLAVELAKLSLWLHTVAQGKPLNFLDHHLKVGNSLIGAWVSELGSLPPPVKRGGAKDTASDSRQMNLFETRLEERLPAMLSRVLEIIRRRSDTLEDIRAKTAADRAVAQLKAPFKAVADLWLSTSFGNDLSEAEYQEALENIGEPGQLLTLDFITKAALIAEAERFFHWEVEFPEVFHVDQSGARRPGFDVVAGNPPYFNVDALPAQRLKALERLYPAIHNNQNDALYYFLVKGAELLHSDGIFAMIVARYLLEAKAAAKLREYLASSVRLRSILDFRNAQVWPDVNILTLILSFSSAKYEPRGPNTFTAIRVGDQQASELPTTVGRLSGLSSLESLPAGCELEAFPVDQAQLGPSPWLLAAAGVQEVKAKISRSSVPLSRLLRSGQGMKSGANEVFVVDEETINRYGIERNLLREYVKTQDIQRYSLSWRGLYVICTYNETDIDGFPATKRYLAEHRSRLETRYQFRDGSCRWFALSIPQNRELFDANVKILTPLYATRNKFALDASAYNEGFVGLTDVYALAPVNENSGHSARYVLALLNSSTLAFWARHSAKLKRGGYYEYASATLDPMPVRQVRFGTPADQRQRLSSRARVLYSGGEHDALLAFVDSVTAAQPAQDDVVHDLLVYLADEMIDTNKRKEAEANAFLDWLASYTGLPIENWRLKTFVQSYWEHGWDQTGRALRGNRKAISEASGRNVEGREAQEAIRREFEESMSKLTPLLERIEWTDRLIDLIVYRLYGLTEEEIAIVEGSAWRV